MVGVHDEARHAIANIQVSTVPATDTEPASLAITDADNERPLGSIAGGYLYPRDERDRAALLKILSREGVTVGQPLTRTPDGSDVVPNMFVQWSVTGLVFATHWQQPRRNLHVAYFNPTTRILWVQGAPLEDVCRRYAARIGLHLAEVRLPPCPWQAEEMIPERSGVSFQPSPTSRRCTRSHAFRR